MRGLILCAVLLPGSLALAWLLGSQLIGTMLRPRRAAREWPRLAARLGLSFETAERSSQGRTFHARLVGRHRGRQVRVTAAFLPGTGQNPASEQTSWQTDGRCPLKIVDRKRLEALAGSHEPKTGDASFDRHFAVHGSREDIERYLNEEARQAVLAASREMGGFQLDGGTLTTASERIHFDAAELGAVLSWHAWVLEALEGEHGAGRPPVPLPSLSRHGSSIICAALIGVSLLSAATIGGSDAFAAPPPELLTPAAAATVWAPWPEHDDWLYPARVVARESSVVLVVFADGSQSRCTPGAVRSLQPERGDSIQVRLGDVWQTVIFIQQHDFAIQYQQQGRVDWTARSRVRFPAF